MIVKADKDYNELFRSAENQLQLQANSITNLHDYFKMIDDHKATIASSDQYSNLVRLPLEADEPYFEIDANTREIKVPPVFQKNGITVKGDKLAEIIYFKMDRFFDLQDFFNFGNFGEDTGNTHTGAHCYIEWYNPSGTSAETQRGVDLAFAMTADEQYIYFGWPIADYVSGDSGTIQFSVRFLDIRNDVIWYNYATKIATCEVKTTLNFPLDDGSITAFSWEQLIYSRPVYSGVINSTESPAPALLYGIISRVADMEYGLIDTETIAGAHHEASGDPNDGHNGEAWDEPDTVEENYGYYLDIPVVANIATASDLQQTLTFKWIKDGSQITSTEEANYVTNLKPAGPILDENETGDYPDTAVKSTYKAHAIGKYTVWIGNKIEGNNKVRYIYTGTITIPGPQEVIADNSNIVSKGYVPDVTLRANIANTVDPNSKVTYIWYNNDGDIVWPRNEEDDDSVFTPDDEGIYYYIAYNSRNGDTTEATDAASSQSSDVRMPPQRLTSLILDFDEESQMLIATAEHEYVDHKIYYQCNRYAPADPIHGTPAEPIAVIHDELLSSTTYEYAPSKPGFYSVTAYEVVFAGDGEHERRNDGHGRSTSEEIQLIELPNGKFQKVVESGN